MRRLLLLCCIVACDACRPICSAEGELGTRIVYQPSSHPLCVNEDRARWGIGGMMSQQALAASTTACVSHAKLLRPRRTRQAAATHVAVDVPCTAPLQSSPTSLMLRLRVVLSRHSSLPTPYNCVALRRVARPEDDAWLMVGSSPGARLLRQVTKDEHPCCQVYAMSEDIPAYCAMLGVTGTQLPRVQQNDRAAHCEAYSVPCLGFRRRWTDFRRRNPRLRETLIQAARRRQGERLGRWERHEQEQRSAGNWGQQEQQAWPTESWDEWGWWQQHHCADWDWSASPAGHNSGALHAEYSQTTYTADTHQPADAQLSSLPLTALPTEDEDSPLETSIEHGPAPAASSHHSSVSDALLPAATVNPPAESGAGGESIPAGNLASSSSSSSELRPGSTDNRAGRPPTPPVPLRRTRRRLAAAATSSSPELVPDGPSYPPLPAGQGPEEDRLAYLRRCLQQALIASSHPSAAWAREKWGGPHQNRAGYGEQNRQFGFEHCGCFLATIGWWRRRPHTSCRDSRRRLNLLSYNCGGFTSAAWAEFTHWLDTQSYDVVVVQETHWQSEGCFTLPRWYCITAAAPTDDKYSGILVMVASKLACPEHIRYTVLHPGRLLHVKIGGLTVTHSSIDVLGVYQYVWRSTATKAENLANRAVIWNQLDKTATKLPVRNTRLVMGDLNTRPPPDLGLESRHLSNSGPQDADASKFRSFIDAANLMTLNTWSGPKAFTHQHAGHRTIIDYILADKDLADVQARRSAPMHHCPLASWKDSKHWPVAANVRLRQAWMHSRRARDTCSIDVQSLRYAVRHDAPEAAQLQVTVERKLRALTVPTTADQLHAAINACLLQACTEAFPLKAKQSADAPRQQALKRDISNSLQSLWAARRVLHEARKHTARALSDVALPRPLDAGDDDDGEG
ncbi:unnamed protein product, partial [Symbiodinium microadriaticum]